MGAIVLLVCTGEVCAQKAVPSHPRLWITTNDLPRLQSWASDSNPIYANGLGLLAQSAKSLMDVVDTNLTPAAPDVPYADDGAASYQSYPTEMYAELFAFMSLISTNQADKLDYARRATNLLMYVMNQAVTGVDTNDPPAPFRNSMFYAYDRDRPRWYGEGWPLAVDWVYPYLSPADKATIRKVFLMWADEIATNTYAQAPTPEGLTNDPSLFVNPSTRFGAPFNPVRWSGNNYFTAHMRNLGLMSMALDAADDPDNRLRSFLGEATGGFLYIVDHLLRTDCQGGLLPEGYEYSPQTAAYIVQFLCALHSAGQDDPAIWGPQVVLTNQPFWPDFLHAYLGSISPVPGYDTDNDRFSYFAAWYGDGQRVFAPDFIHCLGALGIYARNTGDFERLAHLRWMEQYLPPGGMDQFMGRATADINSDSSTFTDNIFYFMLYDPEGAPVTDPRPTEPLDWYVPGMQRIFSRTGWETNDSWITYKLGWSHVDHQLEDGNMFEFYRHGEWLTRELTGYDLDAGSSDDHNTLTLQNDLPNLSTTNDPRYFIYLRGSQWGILSGGDPWIVSHSFQPTFTAVTGDATPLYNSTYEQSTDILHASRSLVWLKPDHIVVYDRATSGTDNRFKRFWLNTPTNALVNGNRAEVTLASGQQFISTTLLPTNAVIDSEPYLELDTGAFEIYGFQANVQQMHNRVMVEAPGGPADTRFLHVLQGADPGSATDTPALIRSTSGSSYEGASISTNAVMFAVNLYDAFSNTTYEVSTNVRNHLVTGLNPNDGYTVSRSASGPNERITISAGGARRADRGGILVVNDQPALSLVSADSGKSHLALMVEGSLPGSSPIVQTSTNLVNWITLGPATTASGAALQYGITNNPAESARFYRVFLP